MQSENMTFKVESCFLCDSHDLVRWGEGDVVEKYKLIQCNNCGFICVGNRPSTEAISKYYSSPLQYDGWIQDIDARKRMWGNRIKLLRGVGIRGSLLDVGTGIGQFLSLVKPFVEEVHGTEV